MKLIESFYKTKHLSNNGIFICIASTLLLSIGYFIPDEPPHKFNQQMVSLNGYNTKHNDQSQVSDFLLSIKNTNGSLVLGTSESTTLKGGNYYTYFNNDKDINTNKLSVLAGAGRTCGMHIPILLHHREEVDSLKLIYFINPVYWRTDLCEVNLEYTNRYCNSKMCNSISLTKQEEEDFFYPIEAYNNKLDWFNMTIAYMEQTIRSARKQYSQNLRYNLNPEEYTSQFNFISSTKTDYTSNPQYGKPDLEQMDTIFNISKKFTHKEWFNPINTATDYRYKELTSFIKLCNDLGIQATFIIGPYNERFIKKYDPKSLNDYKATTENIKQLLIKNNSDFIDATDISATVGAFDDHQHHSSYGAYLIFLKMKKHFYEK
jgi:hypothetical protein